MLVPAVRRRRIFDLALPIIAGMISQNVLNLVDTAMVGTLGDAALAAVGVGSFAAFMLQALILGISPAVQAMAARRKGEGRLGESALVLNGALSMVLLAAPLLSVALFFLVPRLFPLLNQDAAVVALGVPYLQIRILATVFMGMNYAFRGYWNGIDRSRLYMTTLVIMHATNILLNYVLIFGKLGFPALGVTGAGLATAIATATGTLIYTWLGLRHARRNGFLSGLPGADALSGLIRLAVPSGLSQLSFAAGFVALYWIIGQIGTAALAAASVLINVMSTAYLPGLGMGLSASTLVGQALGRRDPGDARQWGLDVTKLAALLMLSLGIPMVLFPEAIISVFIHRPETLALARLPMQISGLTLGFEAIGMVLMHSLLGAGDARRVMQVSIGLQWAVFLPLAYLAGPGLGGGLLAVWVLQILHRGGLAAVFWRFWRGERWQRIRV